MPENLYRHGGRKRNLPRFEKRYGKAKGERVYGAVVGKVRRERMAKGLCSSHGCGAPARHMHGRHGCCGSPQCHGTITMSHMQAGERNVPTRMTPTGLDILDAKGGLDASSMGVSTLAGRGRKEFHDGWW